MKNKISVLGASAILFVLPLMVHAAGLTDFLNTVRGWLNMLVPMMVTLGIIAFFWGLAKFLFGGAEEHKSGLTIMVMGVLAVFVMASLGGLVGMLQDTTGAGKGRTINPPCVGAACVNQGGSGPARLPR
ncbi:MAG: hypothetical protein LRZ97_01720 [Candidatus Pacebacteria bacterium]|nr:hypothetical protein [Candidatus Paceibacterota bacterium]